MNTNNNTNNLILSEYEGKYSIKPNISKQEIITLAIQLIDSQFKAGTGITISDPHDTRDFLKLKLGSLEHEVFAIILLNNRHQIIHYEHLFRGTIDGASVYPREVVKLALKHNAAAAIISHNHPSGNPEPSGADERITKRLQDALNLVEIRLLDHLIVGQCEIVSLAERGLL